MLWQENQGRCSISLFSYFKGRKVAHNIVLILCVCPQFELRIIMNGNLLSDIFAVCDPGCMNAMCKYLPGLSQIWKAYKCAKSYQAKSDDYS